MCCGAVRCDEACVGLGGGVGDDARPLRGWGRGESSFSKGMTIGDVMTYVGRC